MIPNNKYIHFYYAKDKGIVAKEDEVIPTEDKFILKQVCDTIIDIISNRSDFNVDDNSTYQVVATNLNVHMTDFFYNFDFYAKYHADYERGIILIIDVVGDLNDKQFYPARED